MRNISVDPVGIQVVLHKDLLKQRNENTRFTHYDGRPEDLVKIVLHAWFNGRFARSERAVAGDNYMVVLHPRNFYCKKGAVRISDRLDYDIPRFAKKPAARAIAIVRIVERWSQPGRAVKKIEVIDIQAEPEKLNRHSNDSIRQSA